MKTYAGALVLAAALALPHAARAEPAGPIIPPPVPVGLELSPQEFTPFLVAHAVGTQGYVCVANGAVYSWKPFGPDATLFNEDGEQILTHFLGITPYSLVLNPAWQHSRDSSIVWAAKIGGVRGSQLRRARRHSLAAVASRSRRRRADVG